ncbi:MAG: hypothetical protein HC888_12795 [Candidatus Competibacteraceae bacterium]|nr:hypothetical protein [Candidatus Competibacteraceae bacterium]
MKYDMCGAAAVLCTMLNIVELKPVINVICVVPAVENMTGARAQRPGDIVRAYNGKSIEVLNTDAEGRLILADAMSFTVDKYAPDVMVNLATLTGAVVVALGHYAAGIFGNNDELTAQLQAAGEATGERCWPMPCGTTYCALIEGTHADLSNIGPARRSRRNHRGGLPQGLRRRHPPGHTSTSPAPPGAPRTSPTSTPNTPAATACACSPSGSWIRRSVR